MKIFKLLIIALAIVFVGCSNEKIEGKKVSDKSFEEMKKESKGTEVSIYMWGGSKEVNDYFDNFVVPKIKSLYDITLHRVPIDDLKVVLQKIELEKNANRKSSSDIVWINGENFKIAKEKGLLHGPFVSQLPNYNQYINVKNSSNLLDFSEPTEGFEAPFGRSQFVIVYDSLKVKNPPNNVHELFAWIKANPYKFTYPAVPDFTGSAFIRGLFIDYIGGIDNFDKQTYKEELSKFFIELNEIKHLMFKGGSYIPNSSALLDTLYANGDVAFTFSYNPTHALNKIKTSNFPKSSRSAILKSGSLANTHFLAIPKTSSNIEGAMVAINFLLSPEAQFEKAKSDVWGDGSVLSLEKLDKDTQNNFLMLSGHISLLNTKVLLDNQIPELSAKYIEEIENLWVKDVLKK